MSKYRKLRSAGGHLTHIVDKTGTALCGYRPGGMTNMGCRRAGWYASVEVLGSRPCEKCEKALAKIEARERLGEGDTLTKAAKMVIVEALSYHLGDKLFSIAQDHPRDDLEVCEFEFEDWLSDLQWHLKKLINQGNL
jgi:hypothetical protein